MTGTDSKAQQRLQMADIARLAGVSTSTVSRALSGSSLVNEETRARVIALARSLKYSINIGAQNLRLKQNRTVGVVVPYDAATRQHLSDPFFLSMLGSLADALTDFFAGRPGNHRVGFEPGKSGGADQFAVRRVFVSNDKTRVTRRRALRCALPVDHDDARLRVHVGERVCGTESGNSGANHQPIGLLRAAQATALRRMASLRDPAAYVFHASPHRTVVQRLACA